MVWCLGNEGKPWDSPYANRDFQLVFECLTPDRSKAIYKSPYARPGDFRGWCVTQNTWDTVELEPFRDYITQSSNRGLIEKPHYMVQIGARVNDVPLGVVESDLDETEIRVDWKSLLTALFGDEERVRGVCGIPVSSLSTSLQDPTFQETFLEIH